jgi:hypothetical protein
LERWTLPLISAALRVEKLMRQVKTKRMAKVFFFIGFLYPETIFFMKIRIKIMAIGARYLTEKDQRGLILKRGFPEYTSCAAFFTFHA